jgi:triacylglycerol lipase
MNKYIKHVLLTIVFSIIIYLIIKVIILYVKIKKAINISIVNSAFCKKERCEPSSSQLVQSYPNNIDVNKWQLDVAKYCSVIIYSIEKAAQDKVKPLYPFKLSMVKELYDNKEDPIFGVIFTDDNNIWISFRGSLTSNEWEQDFSYQQENMFKTAKHKQIQLDILQNTSKKANVHQGFINVYMKFRDELLSTLKKLDKTKNVIISGHSLGAAIATLVGIDIAQYGRKNVVVYNFASPRIGDNVFKSIVDNMYGTNVSLPVYRVVNICDIVPSIPLSVTPNMDDKDNPYIYVHCGVIINFQQNRLSVLNNHIIPVYMKGLEDMHSNIIY